ncbi:MAG TPA: prenyltransferase/squalene oxidase repeat-containing protein [bacterium]
MTIPDAARRAGAIGRGRLLDVQRSDGRWEGVVRSDPGLTAQFLLMVQFVDRLDLAGDTALLAHLDRSQLPQGGWAAYPGGLPSLDVSLLCYAALRFAGRPPDSEPMRRAREVILRAGGIESCGFIPRFPLVFWSQIPLSGLTYLSPKLLALPRWIHPNFHDLGIFLQPLLSVELLLKQRAARVPPRGTELDELRTGREFPRATLGGTGSVLSRVSKAADALFPARWLDRQAADWLAQQQNPDGLWAGTALFTPRALMALHATDPVRYRHAIDSGVAGMRRLQISDGIGRWQQLGRSPVLDTAIAAAALLEAGVRSDEARLARACHWLLESRSPVGSWSFAPENARTPDTDTTLHVLEVLARAPRSEPSIDQAIGDGLNWLLAMQNPSGGWAMWSAELPVGRSMVRELELNGAVDASTPDATARAVRALVRLNDRGGDRRRIEAAIARAVRYLTRTQRSDGAWPGRWAVSFTYGTAQGLTAMALAGDRSRAASQARRFLETTQQDDGGWGESQEADDTQRFIPARSTVTQTSLALLGLLAVDPAADRTMVRAMRFLLDREHDGWWDDDTFCQTVLPGRMYFQNSLFAASLTVMALARGASAGAGR